MDDATIAGAVLTGGASRRMGRDKALIEIDGVPLADRVASVLRCAGCDPVVAIGGDERLRRRLATPVLPDRLPGHGPLGGVLVALETVADADGPHRDRVVVVACDLPDLTPASIGALIDAARRSDEGAAADVVVARSDRLEPAVAVWSVSALPAVSALHGAGERALRDVIARLRHVEVGLDPAVLRNVNTPDDLHRTPPAPS